MYLIIADVLELVLLFAIIVIIARINKALDVIRDTYSDEEETYNPAELSEYEIARIQREKALDERIRRLQREVLLEAKRLRGGVIAEELHPDVHNLPHSIIANHSEEVEEYAK